MINYTQHRDNKINKLNYKFDFISSSVDSVGNLFLPKSVFCNLFLAKTFQVQFYNFQGKEQDQPNQTTNQAHIEQDEQDIESNSAFCVQLSNGFVHSFDSHFFPRNFKIYI